LDIAALALAVPFSFFAGALFPSSSVVPPQRQFVRILIQDRDMYDVRGKKGSSPLLLKSLKTAGIEASEVIGDRGTG
jgi:hypothetical protein